MDEPFSVVVVLTGKPLAFRNPKKNLFCTVVNHLSRQTQHFANEAGDSYMGDTYPLYLVQGLI